MNYIRIINQVSHLVFLYTKDQDIRLEPRGFEGSTIEIEIGSQPIESGILDAVASGMIRIENRDIPYTPRKYGEEKIEVKSKAKPTKSKK